MIPTSSRRSRLGVCLTVLLAVATGGASFLVGDCGPFTDFTDATFCPFVLEIFYLGITTGTTPTTFDPSSPVSRLQMAAFLSRTVDSALTRGSRRAALDQFWTTKAASALAITTVGSLPEMIASDGADLWVPHFAGGTVARVRASDGRLLETWTGGGVAEGALVAMGKVFVSGNVNPGTLYRIDPAQPAGAMELVASNLGNSPGQMAFDGTRIWAANWGPPGSVSIVTPGASIPWTVTTVTIGPLAFGIVYDGANIWATNSSPRSLEKLDSSGAVLQTVTVGANPQFPAFDGANIWVPGRGGLNVTVLRASTGAILATLTGNGLTDPSSVAFDGKRILVTNPSGHMLSLWKAADLSPLGSLDTGASTGPYGACSNGIDFWVTFEVSNRIARF